MMPEFLAFLVCALAAFDAWLTQRRMRAYGTKIELNPVLVVGARYLSLHWVMLFGIFAPSALIAAFLLYKEFILALAFFAGFRTNLFLIQCLSLLLERKPLLPPPAK